VHGPGTTVAEVLVVVVVADRICVSERKQHRVLIAVGDLLRGDEILARPGPQERAVKVKAGAG